MNNQNPGFSDWFADRAAELLQPGQEVARVVTVDRGACLVRGKGRETAAELSGRFRHAVDSSPDLPCVGDWVGVEYGSADLAIIHCVLPRKTCLRRRRPGKTVDFQMIAANLDLALVVVSCHYDFNLRRLERYLVACRAGGVEPVVILSKADLMTREQVDGLVQDVRGLGLCARILPLSNMTGEGLEDLRACLAPGTTCCLIGSSGVGKSTLINRLTGRNDLDTGVVSATGEGTHTTSRRQLLQLENGAMLIDTPGMRELGLLDAGDGLDESFSDISELARTCRFEDCSHLHEPGCAVLKAVEARELDEDRYQGYLKLKRENEHYDMSYLEKRRKDKNFGRHIKSVMKHKRR